MPTETKRELLRIDTIRIPEYTQPTNYCSAELEGGIVRALTSLHGEMLQLIVRNPFESILRSALLPERFPVTIGISLCRMPAEIDGGWFLDFHTGYREEHRVRYAEFVLFFEEHGDRLFCMNVPNLFFKRI